MVLDLLQLPCVSFHHRHHHQPQWPTRGGQRERENNEFLELKRLGVSTISSVLLGRFLLLSQLWILFLGQCTLFDLKNKVGKKFQRIQDKLKQLRSHT